MFRGYVKVWRAMSDHHLWKHGTPDQRSILIALLLMASHREKSWYWEGKKITVKPGQMITSIDSIREKAGDGTTTQAVRSALLKFKKFDFITEETTKTGRLITIINWGLYQSDNKDDNIDSNIRTTYQQHSNNIATTYEQHSNNIPTTPINNDNNVEEVREEGYSENKNSPHTPAEVQEISTPASGSEAKAKDLPPSLGLPPSPGEPKSEPPAGAGKKRQKKASTGKKKEKKSSYPAWTLWVDCNREVGKADPVAIGPDLGAGKTLGAMVTRNVLTAEELKNLMLAYLKDNDRYIVNTGHPLSLLPKRINTYRNTAVADTRTPTAKRYGKAACDMTDAEIIAIARRDGYFIDDDNNYWNPEQAAATLKADHEDDAREAARLAALAGAPSEEQA